MNDSLTLAIVGHLVGDYLLQNDWMAGNKKASDVPCAVHCMLWTFSVLLFSGWFRVPEPRGGVITAFLFLTHYAQDRTNVVLWWMTRVNRQKQFATGPCAPWSIIVVDNVWHIVAIWAAWKWIAP